METPHVLKECEPHMLVPLNSPISSIVPPNRQIIWAGSRVKLAAVSESAIAIACTFLGSALPAWTLTLDVTGGDQTLVAGRCSAIVVADRYLLLKTRRDLHLTAAYTGARCTALVATVAWCGRCPRRHLTRWASSTTVCWWCTIATPKPPCYLACPWKPTYVMSKVGNHWQRM